MKSSFLKPQFRLSGLIVAAGSLAAGASVAGWVGSGFWLTDLCAHFPLQCALVLLIAALVSAGLRQRAGAIVFALLGVAQGIQLVPQFLPIASAVPTDSIRLVALQINVHTENRRSGQVLDYLSLAAPDLVVLEEVDDRWLRDLAPLAQRLPHRMAEPRGDNFGIALFSRFPIVRQEVLPSGPYDVPTLVVTLRTDAGPFTCFATHPIPPVGARRFDARNLHLKQLAQRVAETPGPRLLLGDLNVSPWSRHFRQFVHQAGLSDSSRGQGFQASWPVGLPLIGVPIDHILHSPEWVVVDRRTGPNVGSDHYPVRVELSLRRTADATSSGSSTPAVQRDHAPPVPAAMSH